MGHHVVEREALSLVGFEIRTSNERAQEIGEHWGRFMVGGIADEIPGRSDDSIVAVYCEYEGDHTQPYTFFLGCQVARGTEVPPGMVAREVPGGSFARFVSQGDQPEAMMSTWQEIWSAPLERSFEADYEVHQPSEPSRVVLFVGCKG